MAGPDEKNRLTIVTFPLSTKIGAVQEIINEDPVLVEFIRKLGVSLTESKGLEVFRQLGNVIATSEGYYGVFRSNQVTKVEHAG